MIYHIIVHANENARKETKVVWNVQFKNAYILLVRVLTKSPPSEIAEKRVESDS